MCGPYGWNMGGWWMMLLMGLFWLLVVAGVIALIVWLVSRTRASGGGQTDAALDILRQRYARGEIDQGEYERMKQELSGGAMP
ncbi:MAG: SHOCT domain-containing protein [Armatimonadota bacterium]|nr:SHOCT domain-containing protein [Armatimonadota bacterium]